MPLLGRKHCDRLGGPVVECGREAPLTLLASTCRCTNSRSAGVRNLHLAGLGASVSQTCSGSHLCQDRLCWNEELMSSRRTSSPAVARFKKELPKLDEFGAPTKP